MISRFNKIALAVLLILLLAVSAWAVDTNFYPCRALTGPGNTGALDEINGADLSDMDTAAVVVPRGNAYFYALDADSGLAESAPDVISPNSSAGLKRWILTGVDINSGTIDGANITIGAGKTLDVSAGTLTLANDQISGDKVEGGTIAATTITTLTSNNVDSRDVSADGAKLDELYTAIGLKDLTASEVNQLENIGTTAISAAEWLVLGAVTNIYPVDATQADQGATNGTAYTVKYLVDTVIGATKNATMYFSHSSGSNTTTYTFSTSETIPSHITSAFQPGAILVDDASNASLTISGPVTASRQQIFDFTTGTGTVTGLTESYVEWWGTDQAAFTAASAGSKIVYALGTYTFASTATLSSNTTIDGLNQGQINAAAVANLRLFTGSGVSNITIRNLTFTATAGVLTAKAVSILQSSNIRVLNCVCDDIELYVNEEGAGYGTTTLTDGILIDGNIIVNSLAATGTEDVKIFYAKNVVITNNYTEGWAQTLYVYGGNSSAAGSLPNHHAPNQDSDRNAYNILIANNVCHPSNAGIGLSQVENAVVANNTIMGGDDATIWVGSSIDVAVTGNTLHEVVDGFTVYGWTENILFESNSTTVKSGGARGTYSYDLPAGNTGPLIYKGNSFDGLTECHDMIFDENAVIEFTDNYSNNMTYWFIGPHNTVKIENNTFRQDILNADGAWTWFMQIGALKDYTSMLTPTLFVNDNTFKYNADLAKKVILLGAPTNNAKAFFTNNKFYTRASSEDIYIQGDYSAIALDVIVKDNHFTGLWDNNSAVTDATNLNVVWGQNYGPSGEAYFDYKTLGATHVFGSTSNFYLNGSVTWDPGNLVDGAGETKAFAVTGAALGDFVHVGPPYDLQDCIITATVRGTNVVELRLQNESTGARDFASGTWKVRVIK